MGFLPYLLIATVPASVLLAAYLGGVASWLPVAYTFGALPLADAAIGVDRSDPTRPHRSLDDLPLAIWILLQVGTTVHVLREVALGDHTPAASAGLLVSLGIMNGAGGITTAHELMHRAGRLHRGAAELLMTSVAYGHFCIEHVLGHHRHVATLRDPATARAGENIYEFLLRCIPASAASAWRLERERLARARARPFTLADRRLRLPLLLAALLAGITATLGPWGLVAFAAQAFVAIVLLETINYVEHYGLLRATDGDQRPERVAPRHSWNSSHRVMGWFLFDLGRHSDHHAMASRPYRELRHHEDAPQLPAGYATMLLAALVPPLWFRIMNPRLPAP